MSVVETTLLESALAAELVALFQNKGWMVELDNIMCVFGTNVETAVTPVGLYVRYDNPTGEPIDFMAPITGEQAARVTFFGQFALHTVKMEWQERWDDELTVSRCLTFVNDTLRGCEQRLNNKNASRYPAIRRPRVLHN